MQDEETSTPIIAVPGAPTADVLSSSGTRRTFSAVQPLAQVPEDESLDAPEPRQPMSHISSVPSNVEGAMSFADWILLAKKLVARAARAQAPEGDPVFELKAPNDHDAGVVLIDSLRRVLREPINPTFLQWFGFRLPGDVADYLHSSALYSV
jgi:hypothetical protein